MEVNNDVEDESFTLIVLSLQTQLGRFPTEEEVKGFIFGTLEERAHIWNNGLKENSNDQYLA